MDKRFWGNLLAGLFGLLSGAKILLEFFGDIDFIVERIKDPGWIRDTYIHIVNFSPEGNMAIFVISLLVLGYFRIKSAKSEIAKVVQLPGTDLILGYSNNNALSVSSPDGHGLNSGPWVTAKISISNNGPNPCHNVKKRGQA